MRYVCEIDHDRAAAGWGDHYWVVDTEFDRPKALLFLLPEREARAMVDKLNGVPPPPYVSGTRKLINRIMGWA